MKENRLCVLFWSFWDWGKVLELDEFVVLQDFDCLCSMIGCINDAFYWEVVVVSTVKFGNRVRRVRLAG